MKVRVIINGVLEMQYERSASDTSYPASEDAIKFVKACITATGEEARKLCPPPTPDNQQPTTAN